MSARTFFDTNVVSYSLDNTDGRKGAIAKSLLRSAVETKSGFLSYQVVQELLNLGYKKFKPPMTQTEARLFLDDVASGFHFVLWSVELTQKAIDVRNRFQFSWYDSLIVAAALEAKCDVLYTEDLNHGQRIEGLVVVNPFR